MKKILLICFLLTSGVLAFAQTTYNVTTIAENSASQAWSNSRGMAINPSGDLIVAVRNKHCIRRIKLPSNVADTIAGTTVTGYVDSPDPALAQFKSPVGVAVDAAGNIYVAEANHVIRKIATNGAVTTIAGTSTTTAGVTTGASGSTDNTDPLLAKFNGPIGVAIATNGDLFVSDVNGIRKIAIISSGVYGAVTTLATGFSTIIGQLVLDVAGDILVISTTDGLVKVNKTTGVKTTIVAGGGTGVRKSDGTSDDDGTLSTGKIGSGYGLAINNTSGDIYVIQAGTSFIRRINIAQNIVESILGGIKSANNAPIDGVGITEKEADATKTLALFNSPQGGVVAPDGSLYVGDTNNSSVRKVTLSPPSPLPVDLISFTAKLESNIVKLDWTTASEKNSSRFEILRSENGSNFAVIGSVNAAGDANIKNYYSFKDNSPLAGIGYYQLRQIDKDGKSKIYAVQAVKFGLQQSFLKVYTSVSNAEVKVFASLEVGGNASLTITDIQGRVVYTSNVALATGQSEISLPLSLTSGLYVATLNVGSEVMVTKFVAQ